MGQCCTREQESKRGGLMPEKRDRQFAAIQMPLSPAHPQRVLRNQQYQDQGDATEYQYGMSSKYQGFEQAEVHASELYSRSNYQERGIYPAAVGEARKPTGSTPFSPYNDSRQALEQKMQRYGQNDPGMNGARRPLVLENDGGNQQPLYHSSYRGALPPGARGHSPSAGGVQLRREQMGVPSSSMDGEAELDNSAEEDRARLSQQALAKPRPAFVPPLPLKQKGIEGQFGSGTS